MRRYGKTGIWTAALTAAVVALVVALPLGAHVERDPVLSIVDPAPDTSIIPAAGGDYVQARALTDPAERLDQFKRFVSKSKKANAAYREAVLARLCGCRRPSRRRRGSSSAPGASPSRLEDPKIQAEETLVVCKGGSATRLRSVFRKRRFAKSRKKNRRVRRQKLELADTWARLCRFDEIQEAVNAADNNDTIVILHGFYTEPASRKARTTTRSAGTWWRRARAAPPRRRTSTASTARTTST